LYVGGGFGPNVNFGGQGFQEFNFR
jgi:hypothetical protein